MVCSLHYQKTTILKRERTLFATTITMLVYKLQANIWLWQVVCGILAGGYNRIHWVSKVRFRVRINLLRLKIQPH